MEGHIYLPKELVQSRTAQLLGVGLEDIEQYLMDLAVDRKIVVKQENGDRSWVYSASSYYMEMSTARMLCDLNITG